MGESLKKKWPKVKKKFSSFLLSEEGKILKKDIGLISAGLVASSIIMANDVLVPTAEAHSNYLHNNSGTGSHGSHSSHGSHGSHASHASHGSDDY